MRSLIVGFGVAIALQIAGLSLNDGVKWWVPMLIMNIAVNIFLITGENKWK